MLLVGTLSSDPPMIEHHSWYSGRWLKKEGLDRLSISRGSPKGHPPGQLDIVCNVLDISVDHGCSKEMSILCVNHVISDQGG